MSTTSTSMTSEIANPLNPKQALGRLGQVLRGSGARPWHVEGRMIERAWGGSVGLDGRTTTGVGRADGQVRQGGHVEDGSGLPGHQRCTQDASYKHL
jgi:hypothetical protein